MLPEALACVRDGILIELKVVRGGSVAPGGLVCDLGAAQRARVLAVEPRGYAELAEYVAAPEPHRRRVVVVAYRA